MPTQGLLGQPAASPQGPDLFPFQRLIRRLTPIEQVRELYRRAQQPTNCSILENLLREMRVECLISDSDRARIPASGPALVTSNHPFGLMDGVVLGTLLSAVRPDVRILTNVLLAEIPELHEHCIFVDPLGGEESAARNRRGVKEAVTWLRSGGMLAMFPSGEVSHLRWPELGISDPQWNSMAARLVRVTKAVTVPVFLRGANNPTLQALAMIHPQLRTVRLMNEFLAQTNRKVEVRIGSRITPEEILRAGSDRQAADYLRWRTYILSRRGQPKRKIPPVWEGVITRKEHHTVVAAIPTEALQQDVTHLSPAHRLFENAEFSVYYAKSPDIPNVLQEIGRLREITFRSVGEGTGQPTDLDRFDHYYTHILLWSKVNNELAGAYRIGLSSEILPRLGVQGFYTNTLFRFDARLFDRLGPALEVGRSFVRHEYQRQYSPLLTLWKGIGRYLVMNPQFAVLFGAVSISNRYCRWSRELIVRFFRSREKNDNLARFINPRRPFRPGWTRPGDAAALQSWFQEVDQLGDPIADLESDGKTVPILIKHYARLGGRILSFNVDRQFSDVLDGFVFVDLRKTDPILLQRYLGTEGAAAFRSYHGLAPEGEPA